MAALGIWNTIADGVFSAPIGHPARAHVLHRSRDQRSAPAPGSRKPNRGWERVGQ